jgi:hypothetical protein
VPNTRRDRIISWSLLAVLPGVALLSVVVPDALDRLPSRERAIAGFLDHAGPCDAPLARVTEVEIDDPDDPRSIRYRCEWTILGIGGHTTRAYCAESRWRYAGWREEQSGPNC